MVSRHGLELLVTLSLLSSIDAAIKAPGWKHCMHNVHALPNKWGSIVSPGFPNGINTQIQCSWVIQANPGFRVKLAFHTLNVTGSRRSCYTQFVEIQDYKVGHSMGKFCGASRPGDYVSYGNKIRFDLQGDTSGAKTKGFDLRYRATRETGGFKKTWAFPAKPKKPNRTKNPSGGRQQSKPTKPRVKKTGPPAKTPNPSKSNKPNSETSEGSDKKSDQDNETKPKQRPSKPSAPNRIPFRLPPVRRVGSPIIYGADKNVRAVDHGYSNVITTESPKESDFDLTMIIIIAVSGAVLIVVIIIIVKMCVCRKKKPDTPTNEAVKTPQVSEKGGLAMVPYPGFIPEQYTTEEIIPQHHRMHSLPMMPPTMPHMHYPMPYGPPMKRMTSRSAATMPYPGIKSSKSKSGSSSKSKTARSSRSHHSRKSERDAETKSHLQRSRSRAGHSRSRSLSYLPSQMDGWIRVDEFSKPRRKKRPSDSDFDSSDDTSDSASDWDSESSFEYRRSKSLSRKRRTKSLSRRQSRPPSYAATAPPLPYYVIEKGRDFDEGYDTARKTGMTTHSAKEKDKSKRKSGKGRKERRSRKYSY